MTVADRKLIDEVESYQRPDVPLRVSRFLGINPKAATPVTSTGTI